jgi:hypothetical protein
VLVKQTFGIPVIGLWCLGSACKARPMTFYTARPILTKSRPAALRCWDHLAETSPEFRSIQRRIWPALAALGGARFPARVDDVGMDTYPDVFGGRIELGQA